MCGGMCVCMCVCACVRECECASLWVPVYVYEGVRLFHGTQNLEF